MTRKANAALRATIAAAILSFSAAGTWAQQTDALPEYAIPVELAACVQKLGSEYTISGRINPFYLRADFDGDGKADHAVLVTKAQSRGLAICHGSGGAPTLLGAGKKLHNSSDLNFDTWQVHAKIKPVEQGAGEDKPPLLLGDAILIEVIDSASAILYWNGKRFVWYQQGD